ncbi:MAG: hypothetical protein OXB86_06665 [Bdellovibrionales bacterium]|nr:hypothetical protein [Bdellovibrionales bacterium]
MKTNTEQKPVTAEEVWQLFRESDRRREKAAQESDRRREKAAQERKKADERREKEREKAAKEREKANKELDKRFNKLYALFNSQWSKLVEALVEGKLVELLQARGVDVNETYTRLQRSYTDEKGELQQREIDIIAANGKEVVAVEVKTTLKPDDVKHFMNTLKIFKRVFSRYKNETIYGAVAYLKSEAEAVIFAERQGLFVIRAAGDSASIINKPNFKPKVF